MARIVGLSAVTHYGLFAFRILLSNVKPSSYLCKYHGNLFYLLYWAQIFTLCMLIFVLCWEKMRCGCRGDQKSIITLLCVFFAIYSYKNRRVHVFQLLCFQCHMHMYAISVLCCVLCTYGIIETKYLRLHKMCSFILSLRMSALHLVAYCLP